MNKVSVRFENLKKDFENIKKLRENIFRILLSSRRNKI